MPEWVPEWLFEGQLVVYAVLAAAIVCVLAVWKKTPRRAYLITAVILAALIALYLALDLTVQSDREQVTHAFAEMAAGVEGHNTDRIFAQVSETYSRHNSNKAAFRTACSGAIQGNAVDRVVLWGFDFAPDYKQKDSPSAERSNVAKVSFYARADGSQGQAPFRIEAVMRRDTDGRWRLQSWEAFTFPNGTSPVHVPYLD